MTNESLYERARELLNGIMKEERDAYPITDKDYFCSDIQEIIDIAGENNYQVYRSNCDDPQVVLIGNKKEKHSAASALFINDLAGKKFFERYKLLAEGYTGNAVHLSKRSYSERLMNEVFRKHNLTPEGNDDVNLRNEQRKILDVYEKYLSIKLKSPLNQRNQRRSDDLVYQAMSILKQREKDCFLPHILDHSEEKVAYLLDGWHVYSPHFIELLETNSVRYVSFITKTH